MTAAPAPTDIRAARPLCPSCGAPSVRILTSVEVMVDVVVEASPEAAEEVRVVDEALGDAAWDEASPTHCPRCDWHGTVSDLGRGVLTGSTGSDRAQRW